MRVIEVKKYPTSTVECVEVLMDYNLIPYKWKRTAKYKLGKADVRVFKNEDDEYNTIITEKGENTKIFNNLNITELINLINLIKVVSKFYYTHDYGAVYLNPYTLDLYVVGGDGGYGYSTKFKSQLMKKYEEDSIDWDKDFEEYVEFNQHVGLELIKNVEWEAETSPNNPEFIVICEISIF